MVPSRAKVIACSFILSLACGLMFAAGAPAPKLVVVVVIDQFRYDYLTRFRADYHGGLNSMLTRGADFTNAFYGQIPTVTAVGHSILLSGAMPAVSGIVSNAWYDRDSKQVVTSVCDWAEKTVGGQQAAKGQTCTDADPASPRKLLVTTLGDELRLAHDGAKVVGVSLKARAAILPSGHAANAAYWFDDVSGNFISSSFYMRQLPAWAVSFNNKKLAEKDIGQHWKEFPQMDFHAPKGSETPYSKIPASPWGNDLVEEFAEQALSGEKLGQRDDTDLLTISFSSNDYIGHAVGPYAPEVRAISVRTDELLGRLFSLIDRKVGLQNTIVVLSADHGVAATPKQDETRKIPGGYISANLDGVVKSALNKRFGTQEWLVADAGETALYFDRDTLSRVKDSTGQAVAQEEVYRVAREALLADPQLHISRVYTRDQLDNGIAGDYLAEAAMNGYNPRRSGDLTIIFEPGYMPGSHGATHFSPYRYDSHVPVLFMGPGIRAGRYDSNIRPNDIASTLADMLDLQPPSGSSGRVLSEMFSR